MHRYFAGEIIGNVLGLEPRRWRRPKKVDFRANKERVREFRDGKGSKNKDGPGAEVGYAKFDWTGLIGRE